MVLNFNCLFIHSTVADMMGVSLVSGSLDPVPSPKPSNSCSCVPLVVFLYKICFVIWCSSWLMLKIVNLNYVALDTFDLVQTDFG